MDPAANPQTTDSLGGFAWDVVAGFWRVLVSHPDYVTAASRAVAVPPSVIDLHVELTPAHALAAVGCGAVEVPRPANTGMGGGAGTGHATNRLAGAVSLALLAVALWISRRGTAMQRRVGARSAATATERSKHPRRRAGVVRSWRSNRRR